MEAEEAEEATAAAEAAATAALLPKLAPVFEWAAAKRATLGRCEFARLCAFADGGEYKEIPEDKWRKLSLDKKRPPAARFDADEGMNLAQLAALLQAQEKSYPGGTARLLAGFDAQQQESVCSPRCSAVPPPPRPRIALHGGAWTGPCVAAHDIVCCGQRHPPTAACRWCHISCGSDAASRAPGRRRRRRRRRRWRRRQRR